MKSMKKRWIALQVVIVLGSFYNMINSANVISEWYGDVTLHFWIYGVIMIFSYGFVVVFCALLSIRGIEFSIKKFKKWVINIVKDELKNDPNVKSSKVKSE